MDARTPPLLRPSLLAASAGIALSACAPSPLAGPAEDDLRATLARTIQRELDHAGRWPEPQTTSRTLAPLPLDERFLLENAREAGPDARPPKAEPFGDNLVGQPTETAALTLEHAVRLALSNNLQVQFARLEPAIAESDVVAAQAAFDFILGAQSTYSRTDRPGVSSGSGFGSTTGNTQREDFDNQLSLRKLLTGGGQVATSLEHNFAEDETAGRDFDPNPSREVGLAFQFDQPLLRNFGSRVALAQVSLNRNAERAAIADLEQQLNQTIHDVERAYWELYRSHWDLAILQRLLERGEEVEEKLTIRREARLEVSQAQLADAVSRVEARRSNVISARIAVRRNSDRLKQLINDPRVPVGSETVLLPVDAPADEAFEFSLLEAMTSAVANRPEMHRAILSIDDATIRKVVADNQRLPQLDLRTQARLSGLDEGFEGYTQAAEGKYLDWLIGVVFEQPIGNRAAEAGARRRNLERTQAVISYRNTAQNVVREVKDALDSINQQYQLVGQRRQARIAAAESLRSLNVEQEQLEGLTAVQLDLRLNRQERLSDAERQEVQALADLNTAISELFRATGTILERNGVQLDVPIASAEVEPWYHRRSTPNTDNALRDAAPPDPQIGYRGYWPPDQGARAANPTTQPIEAPNAEPSPNSAPAPNREAAPSDATPAPASMQEMAPIDG